MTHCVLTPISASASNPIAWHKRCLPLQIVCGNRAGAVTILLDEQGRWGHGEALQGEEQPHFIVRSLREVQQVLEQQLQLLPPPRPPQPLT